MRAIFETVAGNPENQDRGATIEIHPTSPDRIVATSNNHDAPEAVKRLIELVPYRPGALTDDNFLRSHE